MPMLALAAVTWRSLAAISGRRSRSWRAAPRNGRRRPGDRASRNLHDRRRRPGQHRDGVLLLRPRDPQIRALRLRARQLRLRQGNVGLRRHAAVEAVDRQLQVLLVRVDGAAQHRICMSCAASRK